MKVVSTIAGRSYVFTRSGDASPRIYTVAHEPSDVEDRFEIKVDGKPAKLNKQENGTVTVTDETGQVHNVIMPPWASDVTGKQVETRYDVDNSTLIQTIKLYGDEDSPIVVTGAGFACDWLFCTIEFDRETTNLISHFGGIPAAASAACPYLVPGGWPTAICYADIVGMAAWIQGTVSNAYSQGKCVGIRATPYSPAASMHPAIYSGSNCY